MAGENRWWVAGGLVIAGSSDANQNQHSIDRKRPECLICREELHNRRTSSSISTALAPLPPGVVNLRYTVDNDWSGDPAIFFWITLSDNAAHPAILHQTAQGITSFITHKLDPAGQWGLIPYFNFRSQSEQAKLKEEVFG